MFIGVSDDGEVRGLTEGHEKHSVQNQTVTDMNYFYGNTWTMHYRSKTATVVSICFETIAEQEICSVTVGASGKPVFAKPTNTSIPTEFWVRVGNATKQLHGDDMVQYQSDHWG